MSQPPAFPAEVGGYRIDILVAGYPGKSTQNGGIGWSTVVLLRGHGRVILLDTGGFGVRKPLMHRLQVLGLTPADVTDLLLSHAHWDHIVNYQLFPQARLYIGRIEMDWARSMPPGETAVPEMYVEALSREPGLTLLEEGDEVFPNLRVEMGPGHTLGHLVFVLTGDTHDVIFAQDAAKTRAEFVSKRTDMTIDAALSEATIEKMWSLLRAREGNILLPGHDLPMILVDGEVRLVGQRDAGILASFGMSLEDQTVFDLSATA
ncbi:MBL fold metallo-hydrolase [Salipiger sp.]|uniref:MBL fold metallo-hydrolase n=1 Tax=Salipiger sp. TaxID=2078585 RepID=UPI003A9730CF